MSILSVFDKNLLRHKLVDYDSDHAFGAIHQSFDSRWSDDAIERRGIELLRPSFAKEGRKVTYDNKICVPQNSFQELLGLAHNGKLTSHFNFLKPPTDFLRFNKSMKQETLDNIL